VDGFEIALRRRNDAIGINLQDFDTIKQSNFVPDEVKKQIEKRIVAVSNETADQNTPTEKSSGETNGSKELDLADVPEREIIVLSTNELANGVAVKLLNKVFEPHFTAISQNNSLNTQQNVKIQLDELKINIQPEDLNNQKTVLYLSNDKNSFGWSTRDPKLFFKKDVFCYQNNDVSTITFTYTQNSKSWQTAIIVDQKNHNDFIEKTHFTLKIVSPDEVRIVGDFINYINQVKDAQGELIRDKIIFSDPPSHKIIKIGNSYIIKRNEQKQPLIILSERDKNSIKLLFEDCKSKFTEARKDNYNAACLKFFEAIRNAIRGAILARELKLQDESLINEKHKEDAFKLYQSAGGSDSGFKNWKDEIQYKVGNEKLNKTLEELGMKSFSEIPEDSKKRKPVIDLERTMNTLVQNSMAPTERKSLFDELENLNTLQILAPKGRVIFEATRKR